MSDSFQQSPTLPLGPARAQGKVSCYDDFLIFSVIFTGLCWLPCKSFFLIVSVAPSSNCAAWWGEMGCLMGGM